MFKPALYSVIREGYSQKTFISDLSAGIIVGIVAVPLAIAFAIASGVSPEMGLFTIISGGLIISVFGGSRVQIGGPTGAFIIIVYGIVQQFGVPGLTIATILAGLMLLFMGLMRMGSVIKFVPYPLVVGFTSGIALIILSSQVNDLLGLGLTSVPSDFIEKWHAYLSSWDSINFYSAATGIFTILIYIYFSKISRRFPGSLVAIIISTVVVWQFNLPVETIESRFGEIPSTLPGLKIPVVNFEIVRSLIGPAFTIALLGGIESLLSAVVADGMTGTRHKSNTELIAQGGANIFSGLFGGIPATGAIARTATNIKSGGKTPVAGIVHVITVALIVLFAGRWAKMIPMPCLAGILVVVAYNMSEWRTFIALSRGPRFDVLVLGVTFVITVLIDLTLAIQIGMILSAFLFMHRMAGISKVELITSQLNSDEDEKDDSQAITRYFIPEGVDIYEVNGPLFFGAALKFKESMRSVKKKPGILVIRMRYVPAIDGTGLHTLGELIRDLQHSGVKIILSGVQSTVYDELRKSRILFKVGKKNVLPRIDQAMQRVYDLKGHPPLNDFQSPRLSTDIPAEVTPKVN
jgi:sulfate permease, SulP family